jgi:hypothetical protein
MRLTEDEAKKIAHRIGLGHAYHKHAANISESSELLTQSSFESLVLETLLNPAKMRKLAMGRTVFWNSDEEFLVIVNPVDPDKGTAYWPEGGIHGYRVLR